MKTRTELTFLLNPQPMTEVDPGHPKYDNTRGGGVPTHGWIRIWDQETYRSVKLSPDLLEIEDTQDQNSCN